MRDSIRKEVEKLKRVFGLVEAVFDIFYLATAIILSLILLLNASDNSIRMLAGFMALVLACGDAFHLVPRIVVIKTGREEQLSQILGRGKQITSITMTLFYVLLWQIGVRIFLPKDIVSWSYIVYILAAVRIFLSLLPQNQWAERYPPVKWGIWRNVPFFLQGMLVAGLFFIFRESAKEFGMMWFAIVFSFVFYLPVVLWANKNPKIGMLMLPKTCAYLWILSMCLLL